MSSTSSREESNTEDLEDLVQSHEVEDSQELAPEVAEEQGNQDEEAEEAPTRTAEKPKRVVRNPQPKLNAETLKGPKGIHTLPQLFKNTKFKGLGYEEEDLNMLMKSYEYWCHRLFPKFSFDDCLARLEKLGHKKAVQTHLKKIRMDLFVEETSEIPSDNEDQDMANQSEETVTPHDLSLQDSEKLMERIQLNREKALKRLQNAQYGATPSTSSSQMNCESTNEEAIFPHTETSKLLSLATPNHCDSTSSSNFASLEFVGMNLPIEVKNKTGMEINEKTKIVSNKEENSGKNTKISNEIEEAGEDDVEEEIDVESIY